MKGDRYNCPSQEFSLTLSTKLACFLLNHYVSQKRVVKHSVFGKQKTDRPGRRMHHTFEQRQESASAYF